MSEAHEALYEAFASWRSQLEALGIPRAQATLVQQEQMQTRFRSDLASLGIDPADDDQRFGAFAGLAVALKLLIINNAPLPVIAPFVVGCGILLPVLDQGAVEVDGDLRSFLDGIDLGDTPGAPDIPVEPEPVEPVTPYVVFSCSVCGASPASRPFGALVLCDSCAGGIQGQVQAQLRQMFHQPQMGGPNFNRPADPPEPPQAPQPLSPQRWTLIEAIRTIVTGKPPTRGE